MDGWMDGWMDGPWCHSFVGWVFGFAVLERDFVNRFLFWKQMKEEYREDDKRASVGLHAVECDMGWSHGAFILGTPCSEGVTRHKLSRQKKL
jgi:hypothetical protein